MSVKVDKVQLELILNGQKSDTTLKELQRTVKSLRNEMQGLAVGSDEFNSKMKELQTAEKALKKVQNEVKGVGDAMGHASEQGSVFGDMLGALTMERLIEESIAFGVESVNAFMEAEQNAHRLEFALQNVGKEGALAFDKLIEQSGRLQAITKFSDDDIQVSQAMLVNLGLTSDEIEKLIPLVLDYASATGKTLSEATNIAMDAINGKTKALKDSGDEFDDTGSKVENYNILLGKLTKNVGAASAELENGADTLTNWKNAWGDMMEVAGEFAVKTFAGIADGFKTTWAALTGGLSELNAETEKTLRKEQFKESLEEIKRFFESTDLSNA